MSEYRSNTTLEQIAAALDRAQRIVITAHAKPDGDAIGAIVALGLALERAGKTVQRWVMPPLAGNLRVLTEGVELHMAERDSGEEPGGDEPGGPSTFRGPTDEPDRIIVLDTGAWGQLEPLRPWLERRREKIIVIDHHLHGDDVGALMYVDPKAAATCEIVFDLLERRGWDGDRRIAEALYTGIATDTGWFRFSNTTARTHELAAELLRRGVDHAELYACIEQAERPEKLALLRRALDSLRMVAGGQAAIMTLRQSDFDDTGARQEETERLVDLPQIVGDVRIVVLLSENADGRVRLSFRSKPGEDPSATGPAVDVNLLAQRFEGGGHARAAGARVAGPVEQVRQRVIELLEETVGG